MFSARARLGLPGGTNGVEPVTKIEFVTVLTDKDGNRVERRMDMEGRRDDSKPEPKVITYDLNARNL